MNLLHIINGLIGALMAAIMGFSGTTATPEQAAQFQAVATSTDAVVAEAVAEATDTTPEATKQAYELGKSVGRLEAQVEQITNAATTTMATDTPAQTPPTPEPTDTPPAPQEQTSPTPVSLAKITIIDPFGGKGVHNRASAISTSADFDERGQPMNEVIVAAVVIGDDGRTTLDNANVTITATDSSQNKTLNGTGEFHPTLLNGDRVVAPIYVFVYTVKDAGEHTITFSTDTGLTASVTFTASAE